MFDRAKQPRPARAEAVLVELKGAELEQVAGGQQAVSPPRPWWYPPLPPGPQYPQ